MKKTFLHIFSKILLFLICFLFVFLVLRGQPGNPSAVDVNTVNWKDNGPFELSPERGRFALTYSIVEDKSFYFSIPLARFVVPDLGYKNGHYVSLFAPGISFIAMPGYLVGKILGASQVGTFAVISLFALSNFGLIKLISKALGANEASSWLASFVFLFATPAFAYGVTLYQHHLSTFLILLSVYILLKTKKAWPLFFVWFLYAASIPIDYPNLFLMFPIGIWALFKIIKVQKMFRKFKVKLSILNLLVFLGVVIPLLFFMWFNFKSYGNPFQFSGTVPGVRALDEEGKPAVLQTIPLEETEEYLNPEKQQKSALAFFKSRYILNGLYIHFFSPDRGIITFTPVILLGVIGAIILYRHRNKYLAVLVNIVLVNIVLYSMWGDPWGGWAFGSRYLIPAYAILAIFIAIALSRLREKYLFIFLFWLLMVYSVGVNTLGALTSNTNPPKIQVLALEKLSGREQKYTYLRNWDQIIAGKSKSFVFQTWASNYISARQYYYLIAGSIVLVVTSLTLALLRGSKNEE